MKMKMKVSTMTLTTSVSIDLHAFCFEFSICGDIGLRDICLLSNKIKTDGTSLVVLPSQKKKKLKTQHPVSVSMTHGSFTHINPQSLSAVSFRNFFSTYYSPVTRCTRNHASAPR